MTQLLLVFTVLFSTASFADTCFKALTAIPVVYNIPETVCIKSAQINLVIPSFPKKPYYEAVVDSSIGTISEIAKSYEQRAPFRFSVTKNIIEQNDWSCEEYFASDLNVTFETDAQGNTIENSIRVYGETHHTSDRCHLSIVSKVIEFSKI